MAVLREYHAELGRLVLAHEGTLERFAGDGMMIFFNDPVPVPDPPSGRCGWRWRCASGSRPSPSAGGSRGHDLGFGVGIAQGYATIGAIGFEGRWDYGAIGTVTNLAARLCGEAGPGQILVPRRVLAAVEALVEAEPVGDLGLKGLPPSGGRLQPAEAAGLSLSPPGERVRVRGHTTCGFTLTRPSPWKGEGAEGILAGVHEGPPRQPRLSEEPGRCGADAGGARPRRRAGGRPSRRRRLPGRQHLRLHRAGQDGVDRRDPRAGRVEGEAARPAPGGHGLSLAALRGRAARRAARDRRHPRDRRARPRGGRGPRARPAPRVGRPARRPATCTTPTRPACGWAACRTPT